MIRKQIYNLFFVFLLVTEFYYIHIGGGVARPYHFLAVLMVLFLARYVPLLFESRVFVALLVFVGVNLCAILLSETSERALASFLSFCANLAVAMSTALILLTGRVKLASFKRIILTVTLVSVLWGLLQIVAFRFTGVVLALSPEQATQIPMGFGPAFRTEANTFGKYMVFPVLLFLPELIEHKHVKHINLIYIVFFIGILMNFTRSSIYGMGIALFFIVVWYARRHKFFLLTTKSVKIASAIAIGIVLMVGGALNIGEYSLHKIDNLFNEAEILEGYSSAYRLESMQLVIDDALSSTKKESSAMAGDRHALIFVALRCRRVARI